MGDKKSLIISWVTWIVRICVGGLFIFSGFVKAIDPWGTLFKFDEYFSALGVNVWTDLKVVGVFGLCGLEFVTGVFILLGCFRKSWPWVAAFIMAFMLPLTLWIALESPVSDCGCFGDAWKLTNWQTFWKNVALSVGIIWLIIYDKKSHWLITPALQWIAFVVSAIYIVIISLFGYVYQPLIDFRKFAIGNTLVSDYNSEDEPEYLFVYERNGEQKEFSQNDELPDEAEGWKFVERREIKNQTTDSDTADGLIIFDKSNGEVVSDEAINNEGKELIIVMPDVSEVSPATTWKLNSLYEWSQNNGVRMIALVSGNKEEIAEWEDLSLAAYPIYLADDTQLKELVRGNPGVVYLLDGKVRWKSTLRAINIDDFLSPDTSHDADNFDLDNESILRNISYIYLIVMAVLVGLSFLSELKEIVAFIKERRNKRRAKFREFFRNQREFKHDDKAPRE